MSDSAALDGLTDGEREQVYARLPLLDRLRKMSPKEREKFEQMRTPAQHEQQVREQMIFQSAVWAKSVLRGEGIEHPQAVEWGLDTGEADDLHHFGKGPRSQRDEA